MSATTRSPVDSKMGRRQALRLMTGSSTALLTSCALGHGRHPTTPSGIANWARLQKDIQGRVVPLAATDYESTRRAMAWNALKPQRFPDVIVRVASEADVRTAVRFARQRNLKVAVRGGGHNWHNSALRQGGLLLDLSALNQVQVDSEHRTAVVQPGVTGAAIMTQLAPHGLGFPSCHAPQVRLSGFLLNGGLGWNYGVWGPSCASVEAIEVVDARGESLRADRNHNADLFWAARGAGPGFFGVVTQFHLRVFPLPRAILTSRLAFRIEDFDKVAEWLPQLVRAASHAELSCAFTRQGGSIDAYAFAGTVSDGHNALEPFETEPAGLSARSKNLYREASVENVFGSASTVVTEGPRYAGDSGWSNASPSDLLFTVRDRIRSAPSGGSFVQLWFPQGQAWSQQEMAFSMFASAYVHVHSIWNDPTQDTVNQTWVRDTSGSLDPLKVGHYVGEADLTTAPDRAKQCFSPSAWNKLIQLKRKYDPDDMFFSYLQQS